MMKSPTIAKKHRADLRRGAAYADGFCVLFGAAA
jgi:hypothetical protein